MEYRAILDFWFNEIEPSKWWVKDLVFDQMISERFSEVHQAANRCELFEWRQTAQGRLAEIIVLDQFSRNIYRDLPQSFASDQLALILAQEAVQCGADKALNPQQKNMLYMPYMHSETLLIHDQAVSLFSNNNLPDTLAFEMKHRDIIQKFGRYPHRNKILGRVSTEAETAFLKQPGSSF